MWTVRRLVEGGSESCGVVSVTEAAAGIDAAAPEVDEEVDAEVGDAAADVAAAAAFFWRCRVRFDVTGT